MHVTVVSTPPDESSGVGQYAARLAERLATRTSLSRVFLPTDGANPAPFVLAAVRGCPTETDLVHVQFDYVLFGPNGLYTLLFFPLLSVQSRRHDAAVVVTMHEVLTDASLAPPLTGIKRLYLRALNGTVSTCSDAVVVLSPEAERRYRSTAGRGECVHIPHGVDLEGTRDIETAAAKRRFGYDPDEFVAVEPGYVSPRKGSDVFARLAEQCPDISFLLAGGPPRPRHRSFFREIESREIPNLTITGRLPEEEFHAAFVAADVVVLPYNETEQTGVVNAVNQSGVFNWCAAYGVPVIAADCARFRTLSTEWNAVRLFEVSDLEEATSVLRDVREDAAERDRLSAAIEACASARSLARAVEDHHSLYTRLRES